jgi:nucleotide-binding universal stress UspA family protein
VTASDAVAGPYNHVVVGTDGSATAEAAVRHAADLAKACGAALTIVSAYTRSDPEPGAATPAGEEWIATDAAGAQDRVVAGVDVAAKSGVQDARGRTGAGDPASVLLDIAGDVGADVIVVGSRGMASASRFLLGSVPNRVSHHASCDVIIVRTGN